MSLEKALLISQFLLAFSMLLQSLELRAINRSLLSSHPWHWRQIQNEFKNWPNFWRKLFQSLFLSHFQILIWIQFALILSLFWQSHWFFLLALLVSHLLVNLRFRGVFNGGSDYMTMVVILGLFLSSLLPRQEQKLAYGLYYIAIQCTLSYFIAGIVKLQNSQWRNGHALQVFILYSNYSAPPALKRMAQQSWFNRVGAWSVILWECTFPLVWLVPQLITPYLVIGFCFHLAIFYSFGLNRFLFAWLASYPALYFCVQRL